MNQDRMKKAFVEAQANLRIEGIHLPDSAFELFCRKLNGEITQKEFDESVAALVKA